jgi:polysaccharide biosynthesis transport protein
MNLPKPWLESPRDQLPWQPQYLDRIQELYSAPVLEWSFADYRRILLKRKWTILVSALLVVTVAGLVSLRITKVYEATARISIAPQASNFLNFGDKPQPPADAGNDLSVDTQVNILQSNTLALLVIRRLGLDARPEFTGSAASATQPGKISELSSLNLGSEEQLIQRFRENLQVQQVPNTSIVEIKYSSSDASLAAEIVNATVETFIEQNIKTRYESTMQAADWLSKQLTDLEIKVESSQAKLVQYQKDNGIVGADDKQNLTVEKLDGLNRELTQAQADRIQKQSLYEIAHSGNAETVGTILQDPLLSNLRQQVTDLEAQDAQLSTQFGTSYPKVLEVRSRLRLLKDAYNRELQIGLRRVQNDFEAAEKREQMLQHALDAQTALANQLNVSAIQYKLLKQEADSNRQLYDGLLEKLKEASLAAGLNSSNIRVVDQARVPLTPAQPNIPRNLEYALIAGLVGGIALALALESMDTTVRTPEQLESVSTLSVLGVIPLNDELEKQRKPRIALLLKAKPSGKPTTTSLVTHFEPQSEMAEAYRALRTSILLPSAGTPPQTIVVTSPTPQDGKTITSINTAIVLAQQGKKVLLVDADMRKPSVHLPFGIHPQAGLSSLLGGGAKLNAAIFKTRQPNLWVLPAGALPPQPSELLSSPLMQELFQGWREEYDHIILDSPPVLSVTDAVLLSVQADAVVLVVRANHTATGAIRRARDLLLHVRSNLLGVVLNAVNMASLGDSYSSSRYSLYYTDSKRNGDSRTLIEEENDKQELRSAGSGSP